MCSHPRKGFTLIELMVAMALTMFIMVILSQAFVLALETFSNMTGIGEMNTNLRSAATILRADLAEDHFEGKRRLSDLNMMGGPDIADPLRPPQAGFFAFKLNSACVPYPVPPAAIPPFPYLEEGKDANGMPSFRAVDQFIYFTSKRKGNRPEHFYSTALQVPPPPAPPAPPGPVGPPTLDAFFAKQTAYNMLPTVNFNVATPDLPNSTQTTPHIPGLNRTTAFYSSQWAEIMYYLIRTGSTDEQNNPASIIGTPTYGLYRAEFVMTPHSSEVNSAALPGAALASFAGMSCSAVAAGPAAQVLRFNSPDDAAQGQRMAPDIGTFAFNAATGVRFAPAQTLVLPNVISFHVQVMPVGANVFGDVSLYDTTRFGSGGYYTSGLKAIQITMRVWDHKTRQTRQMTIIQDL
jgi:prepilin-type N-terminal cleavage/methylation domain-containing protein